MDSQEDIFHLGAKALIFNSENRLLLLQLHPKKCRNAEGSCWDIPGGRIQKNESLEEALKREVYEETGLQHITKIKPFTMVLSRIRIPIQNGNVGLVLATYLCELEGEDYIRLSNEHAHFEWFDPLKAAKLLATSYPIELTEKLAKLSEELALKGNHDV